MDRKQTTKFLQELLLRDRLSGLGKYWASEVSIDPWTEKGKGGRVDYMQFLPVNTYSLSGLEKGIFICYELKSCKEDVYSGNGLNFYGEKNYIVTTMQCYKDILPDLKNGKLIAHIKETNPESSMHVGIMVAVPYCRSAAEEFQNPTPLSDDTRWRLDIIQHCHQGERRKSMTELLFDMVRSGQ